jgi:hypothetical protein
MEAYRERLQKLIYNATGTYDVLTLPLERFDDKSRINFERITGSVRLSNRMIKTESETQDFINEVLNTRLP